MSEYCKLCESYAMEIADLEAKLAESESRFQVHKQTDVRTIQDQTDLIEQLKQQLAEKEKEIDELQDKLHSYYEEIMNKGTCGLCEYVRTDYKISFAVEQLEKVKEFVKENESWEIDGSDYSIVYADDVLVLIDNQIKQLTHQHEDKGE